MPPFAATSERLLHFTDVLLNVTRVRRQHQQIPAMLELQTICRETGCRLPELESFAQAQDAKPGLLILGGSVPFVKSVASVFNLKADPPHMPQIPIGWSIETSDRESARIRYGRTDHEVSLTTLAAFLTSDFKVDDLVRIDETVTGDSPWRVLWVPYPELLDDLLGGSGCVELFLAHRAAICVSDSMHEPVLHIIKEHGQKTWTIPATETEFPDALMRLLDEVKSLLTEPAGERDIRRVPQWNWLSVRLRARIEERKLAYRVILDRHAGHVRTCRQVLQQYRRNWAGGLHNLLEDYLQSRTTGSAMSTLVDLQKDGLRPETYIPAIAFNNLSAKLEAFITDRMAEFVSGLGALAAKLELYRISLGDGSIRWNTRSLAQRCEAALNEKRVFPEISKKRGGLVRNLTQRSTALSDEKKAQLQRAARVVAQTVEADFAAWSESLMLSVEGTVRVQLIAALANAGHPDPEGIELATSGLDRVEQAILGRQMDDQTTEQAAIDCLTTLTGNLRLSRYRLIG